MIDHELPSEELAAPGRDERGRFLPGNGAAVTHGGRRSLQHPDLAVAVAEERLALLEHLGGPANVSTTKRHLVESTARALVLCDGAFNAMVAAGGPVTHKGNLRAIFNAWDRLDEKVAKRMERLGLERVERKVQGGPLDYIEGRIDG